MLNSVILIGRLTRDPELRYTTNGTALCRFSLAVQRKFNKDEADFIDIVAWRTLAENCANYLGKGRLVAVEGRLQVRSYETQDGQRRRSTDVIADDVRFLDRAPSSDRAGSPPDSYRSTDTSQENWHDLGREVSLEDIDIVDKDGNDEIPF